MTHDSPSAPHANDRPPVRLEFGQDVSCTDGAIGRLTDFVVDPRPHRITHLVVQPKHAPAKARLVPIELARAGEGGIQLECAMAEVWQLPPVREVASFQLGQFPTADSDSDVGIQDVSVLPYFGPGGGGVDCQTDPAPEMLMTYDRVPKGEVEVRRQSSVVTADGHHAGHVDGFVVKGDAITHIVVQRDRLWRRRTRSIPIEAVAALRTDEVTLRLSASDLKRKRIGSAAVHSWRH
jgi:hypothetical protein